MVEARPVLAHQFWREDACSGEKTAEKQVRGRVGVDALTLVNKAYGHKRPFRFTGTIEKVRFDFGDGTDLTPQDKLDLQLAMD